MISVATTEDELAGVCERLRALGARSIDVVAPGGSRRVVLVSVEDERSVAGLVATLRAEGFMAVTRPNGGVALKKWLRDTRPITFGGRITVCRAWSEHDRRGLAGLVELGPGGFGDGRHPTTAQIIEELVDRIAGGERVLDVGCGSGVLGLCALRLGAATVVAVDVDLDAVEAARRNAGINGMGARMEATLTPLSGIEGSFDVVMANIARAGIVELASELVAHVSPDRWLAVGGISPSQCDQVAGFLLPLTEVGRRASGEWATLLLARS
ncbi:MAG: 50S ribosomal protein L11 methyltransferase [Acidimicrobiaceae bacterium]|nr:50S ribosomal protein L11 methyltransferase [Acidimicrobiaceae bacterium]MDE0664133.1 50S ribosomal protein L11 methyltransferase [Acidimicrobiaceae bacterium]